MPARKMISAPAERSRGATAPLAPTLLSPSALELAASVKTPELAPGVEV